MFDKKEEKENILSAQVAADQLNMILDYYDLNIDDLQSKDQKGMFRECRTKAERAIMDGRILVKNENGFPKIEQRLKSGTILEYRELKGGHKIAMKDRDEGDMYGRIYDLVGAMTGIGGSAIEELKGKDMSIVESLGFFFLKV